MCNPIVHFGIELKFTLPSVSHSYKKYGLCVQTFSTIQINNVHLILYLRLNNLSSYTGDTQK